MRIVIDMQGAQSESRFRGIGRYTMSFTQALVRNRGDHEIILALNGLFPDTIEPIRAAFDSLLPQENIRVWHAPGPVRDLESANEGRREVAEIIREAFLASLQPDIIHISSLFEGFVDDVVTSIGRFDQRTPVSVSLYDLIPLLNPEKFLDPNPLYKKNYLAKLEHLKKASLYLAISDFTLQECRSHLPFLDKQGINVSTAIESHFKPLSLEKEAFENLKQKFSLSRPFIFYTGGADDHKNLPRLIEAFAALNPDIRAKYQIVFGGRIPEGNRSLLRHHAKSCGLKPDDTLFTGYLSEDELLSLYNTCRLMAFTSWHEGFGLPVLEAMSCGTPVICGNRSSLPEVIGLEEAMFDPFDVKSIAAKISQALEDESFRARLRSHGLKRAKLFSWDESAKKAIVGFEKIHSSHRQNISLIPPISRKPKLAFVSPLPPERTGIADFCAELLPSLAKYYDIELIVAQENMAPEILARFPKPKDIDWLIQNASKMDRVLYHFGNSPFHSHMFDALKEVPGVVVLHDLFLSSVIKYEEECGLKPSFWAKELYCSHGYSALREYVKSLDRETEKFKYPCSRSITVESLTIIVHSQHSKSLIGKFYGNSISDKCFVLPLARAIPSQNDKKSARAKLGIKADDFIFCSFGFLDPTKLNDRLLLAWLRSSMSKNKNCHLIFVGLNHIGEYGRSLLHIIKENNLSRNVQITGFVSPDQFRDYLSAMDAAVQLRTNSRGETSAAVLDVMASGKPLIVNAHGSLAELDCEAVCVIPDEFEDAQLVQAMQSIHADAAKAQRLGDLAREIVATKHLPENCAAEYFRIIETSYQSPKKLSPKVITAIADRVVLHESSNNLSDISQCLAASWPAQERKKCLFLDISATCINDLKTGIERVARSLLLAFLEREDIRCEPVRLVCENGKWVYRYARAYTSNLLEIPQLFEDELLETLPGDIILSLDLSGGMLIGAEQQGLFRGLCNQGVTIYHIVFDLLPVRMPEVFPPGAGDGHEQWLRSVTKSDGVFCISKAVAEDFSPWIFEKQLLSEQRLPFRVDWFHLSPEIFASSPTSGLPAGADKVLKYIQGHITFLMVGTIEPRKGYLQTLEAFDILWREGVEANLVVVGKEGWQPLPQEARRDIPETISRIKNHLQLNKRLFWLEGISDEYLEKVYAASTCLIAASYGEGFGLPLIEAAQHGLPILARDIPVFREVAGEHAAYFKSETQSELAVAIKSWLADYQKNTHPKSVGIKHLTWDEAAKILLQKMNANATEGVMQSHFLPSQEKSIQPFANPSPNLNFIPERQLLVDVSELCQRDSATGVQRVVRSYLFELLLSPPKGFRVEPVFATRVDGYRYARNFKNRFLGFSEAELPEEEVRCQRGDIFFALDMQHHVQLSHSSFYSKIRANGVTVKFLVYDLLPIQLPNLFLHSDASQLHEQLMTIVARSDEAICISKATADALLNWIKENNIPTSPNFSASWVHIGSDFDRVKPSEGISAEAECTLQLISSRPAFLCVSTIEPRKGQEQILDAFELLWSQGQELNLIFIGQEGWKMEPFAHRLETHTENGKKLFWLKGISDQYLEKVYAASTCLVAASLNEGFGLPLIEAARHGVPIIARDIPVFREVAGEGAYYFKGYQAIDLAESIAVWIKLYKQAKHPKSDRLQWSTWKESTEKLKESLTKKSYPRKQIFFDISELVQKDVGSGIQRVVRSILKESLANPPSGYRIEPVYATTTEEYRYARQFARHFDPLIPENIHDEPIVFESGDIFLGLDLQPQVILAQKAFYQTLRNNGVNVRFLIYDLLTILLPNHFPPGSDEEFSQWLKVVGESDGAICISKAVADEALQWFHKDLSNRTRPFSINWFHLGADMSHHAPLGGLPSDSDKVLATLKQRKTFLIVSTIEPGKAHAQVLEAFEALWSSGVDLNLVIVGKQGWLVDDVCEKLRAHAELDQRLFWLEGISDEYLEKVYAASTCLIAASYGEGFGLPLIEAAQHGLPILARDIPVFREVAGEHAAYFKSETPNELAVAIKSWLADCQKNTHPKSSAMNYLTWKESAAMLLNKICQGETIKDSEKTEPLAYAS